MTQKQASTQPATLLSLDDAIEQVQNAVSKSRSLPSEDKIGAIIGKVTIVLRLAATKADTNSTSGTIGVALPPVSGGFSAAATTTATDSVENTLTLEFANPLLASKDSLLSLIVAEKDAERRNEMLDALGKFESILSAK